MEKIVCDVETLDDYDPTIVDGFLTRFLIERFFVHPPARGEKTRPKPHDIARVVDEAKRDVAHSSFAAVTEDNVRRALALSSRSEERASLGIVRTSFTSSPRTRASRGTRFYRPTSGISPPRATFSISTPRLGTTTNARRTFERLKNSSTVAILWDARGTRSWGTPEKASTRSITRCTPSPTRSVEFAPC